MKKILLSIVLLIICLTAQSQDIVSAVKNSDGTYRLKKKSIFDKTSVPCDACMDINNYKNILKPKGIKDHHNVFCSLTPHIKYQKVRMGIGVFGDLATSYFSPENIALEGNMYSSVSAYNISYSYGVIHWLDVGLSATYKNRDSRGRSTIDNSIVWSASKHSLTIAPLIRVFWLKRKHIDVYSGVLVGFEVEHDVRKDADYSWTYRNFSFDGQLTILGFSVGERLFAFGEFGVGTQGVFMGGIGYRFLDKK